MNMEKTGAYLASLRKGRDMTQQQVADILGTRTLDTRNHNPVL